MANSFLENEPGDGSAVRSGSESGMNSQSRVTVTLTLTNNTTQQHNNMVEMDQS
ncbi:hypothetical protein EYF80_066617 [Liparis tanakae]|uniref:Uncharacterized protein n=1 Tax=Liparis tanakae TaxID=230148 RepID=A0A4Z2E3P5_9TELE|nr:hypothetical protein EYF80_066617 [Liparis tanakae]